MHWAWLSRKVTEQSPSVMPPSGQVGRERDGRVRRGGRSQDTKDFECQDQAFPCRVGASGQSAGPPPGAHERVKITLQDQPLLVR